MKMKIRYPPIALPGESRTAWENRALRPWRMEIKIKLLAERGWKCCRCLSKVLPLDLDESVIPRSQMPRDPQRRRLAFGCPNLEIACAKCNREEAHNPKAAWDRQVKIYGLETMKEWYRGIGLKSPRNEFINDS